MKDSAKTKPQKQIVRRLLAWYEVNRRKLPWRATHDPYRIWVSEIMLQQTQVSRATEYYKNFLQRFPTLRSLSQAQWREVLPVWRGLGYYQRGRNMLLAAKKLEKSSGGKFPKNPEVLLQLAGIGPYTAHAIASFAFGADTPAIDTNLRRVAERFFGQTGKAVEDSLRQLFSAIPGSGPTLNHTFMDIGATLCRARSVQCELCPLRRECQFAQQGGEIVTAKREKRKREIKTDVGIACIHEEGRYLIAKRSRSRGGEWEFPGGKREKGEDIRACLKREIREELGVEIAVRPPFLITTNRENQYRFHFCRCQILRGKPKLLEHSAFKWLTVSELLGHPLCKHDKVALAKLPKR